MMLDKKEFEERFNAVSEELKFFSSQLLPSTEMMLDKKEFEEKLNAVSEELKAYKDKAVLETMGLKEELKALREDQDVTTNMLTFAIADLVAILKVDTSVSTLVL